MVFFRKYHKSRTFLSLAPCAHLSTNQSIDSKAVLWSGGWKIELDRTEHTSFLTGLEQIRTSIFKNFTTKINKKKYEEKFWKKILKKGLKKKNQKKFWIFFLVLKVRRPGRKTSGFQSGFWKFAGLLDWMWWSVEPYWKMSTYRRLKILSYDRRNLHRKESRCPWLQNCRIH